MGPSSNEKFTALAPPGSLPTRPRASTSSSGMAMMWLTTNSRSSGADLGGGPRSPPPAAVPLVPVPPARAGGRWTGCRRRHSPVVRRLRQGDPAHVRGRSCAPHRASRAGARRKLREKRGTTSRYALSEAARGGLRDRANTGAAGLAAGARRRRGAATAAARRCMRYARIGAFGARQRAGRTGSVSQAASPAGASRRSATAPRWSRPTPPGTRRSRSGLSSASWKQ